MKTGKNWTKKMVKRLSSSCPMAPSNTGCKSFWTDLDVMREKEKLIFIRMTPNLQGLFIMIFYVTQKIFHSNLLRSFVKKIFHRSKNNFKIDNRNQFRKDEKLKLLFLDGTSNCKKWASEQWTCIKPVEINLTLIIVSFNKNI